jgi:hypothetical protein
VIEVTRWVFVALLVGSTGMFCGKSDAQKQRYSSGSKAEQMDYPLTVRVTHAQLMRPFPSAGAEQSSSSYLHLDALIDGKHVQLEANAAALLHVGDYPGRIVTNNETKAGFFTRSYELLFVDGTHVLFTEVAETE